MARGVLTAGVYGQLRQLAEKLDVHVVSADTRGTATEQLHDLPSRLHILTGSDHDVQKRDLAKQFDLRRKSDGRVRGLCQETIKNPWGENYSR